LNNKLTKEERLNSKKVIENLFGNGKSLFLYPYKVFYVYEDKPSEYPVQVLISVSKRNFKKAIDRNRIKRLVREAYRMNKNSLLDSLGPHNKSMILGLIYVGETILSYQEIERKLILILHRLIEQDEEHIG
jgi:ribonuclease P protein component